LKFSNVIFSYDLFYKQLPDLINGKPISQYGLVLIKYLDKSDSSVEKRVLVKSIQLVKTFAKVEKTG